MIDLKKLQDKFDALFEQETEESFNKWLDEKMEREIMSLLGKGKIEVMASNDLMLVENLVSTPSLDLKIINSSNNIASNTQYAMAA